MPKIYEYFGLEFFIYKKGHLPIHIHVKHNKHETVFEIQDDGSLNIRRNKLILVII